MPEFFVFLVNILIDFRINSLDRSILIQFFDNYDEIDLLMSDDEVADELLRQIRDCFESYRLKSKISFVPTHEHMNVISYDTFHREHLPLSVSVNKDDFYYDYHFYLTALTDAKSLRVPYRKDSRGGPIKRHCWLAKTSEVDSLRRTPTLSFATDVNDVLGLGFSDSSRPGNATLLLRIIFPASFRNDCFKPTFVDGPLSDFKTSLFMNSISIGGYGLTRSTNGGTREVCECLTDAVSHFTSDFRVEALGYAEPMVDKSNMKRGVLTRYART